MFRQYLQNTSLFVVLLFGAGKLFAQSIKVKTILQQDVRFVNVYKFDQRSYSSIGLVSRYGNTQIQNPGELHKIKPENIKRIDLVYSNYPAHAYNDLTEKRLMSLFKLDPKLFDRNDIEWNLVVQTECQDETAAKSLFHGFAVYYRDPSKKPANQADLTYMKNSFKSTSPEDLSKLSFKDSTVIKALSRNSGWRNILVVADLTGSMSPYVAQLLVWYRLNTNRDIVKHWVFFNDGDFKTNEEKKIGETGGIYDRGPASFESVLSLTYETMQNGNGGDAAENDLEAIIKGISLCSECDDIVVIADNHSPVRDMELLSKINRPVHLILCGSQSGINTQFLNIARQTGGSVHSMEDDLTRLIELNEGESIKMGKQTFRVENGKMVSVKTL